MTVQTTTRPAPTAGPAAISRPRNTPWCAVIVLAAAALGFALAVLGVMALWS